MRRSASNKNDMPNTDATGRRVKPNNSGMKEPNSLQPQGANKRMMQQFLNRDPSEK